MADRRTRHEKLMAMAADRSSPNEAAIARQMLKKTTPPMEVPTDMYLYSDDTARWMSRSGRKTTIRWRTFDGLVDYEEEIMMDFKPSGPDRR